MDNSDSGNPKPHHSKAKWIVAGVALVAVVVTAFVLVPSSGLQGKILKLSSETVTPTETVKSSTGVTKSSVTPTTKTETTSIAVTSEAVEKVSTTSDTSLSLDPNVLYDGENLARLIRQVYENLDQKLDVVNANLLIMDDKLDTVQYALTSHTNSLDAIRSDISLFHNQFMSYSASYHSWVANAWFPFIAEWTPFYQTYIQ